MTQPTTPDDSYLKSVAAATERAVATAAPIRSEHDGASAAVRDRAEQWLDEHAADLLGLSHDLHEHPEEGFAEHRSVAAVAELLRAQGFDAQVGVGELPTALLASTGGDGPHVAVLAEYDALPGVGHACGHNIICLSLIHI